VTRPSDDAVIGHLLHGEYDPAVQHIVDVLAGQTEQDGVTRDQHLARIYVTGSGKRGNRTVATMACMLCGDADLVADPISLASIVRAADAHITATLPATWRTVRANGENWRLPPGAQDLRLGCGIIAHTRLGWCMNCPGVGPNAEALAWRVYAMGDPRIGDYAWAVDVTRAGGR
jgi:hypothetical protein